MQQLAKSVLQLKWIVSACLALSTHLAHADTTWRAGAGFGFGGAGIDKQIARDEGNVIAKRSEGPATLHFFIERLIDEDLVISIEHARGARLGPFSSGVSFTSGALLWHYFSPAPDVKKMNEHSGLFVKNWSPYTGLSAGIAEGTIRRERDEVPSISSSGFFFGLRNGVDYLLAPDMGLRIELSTASTFFQAQQAPAKMTFFSLWCGIFIPAF